MVKVKKVNHKKTTKKQGKGSGRLFKSLPFKFSIVSVAILGCLTLVAVGVYHFAPQNDAHVLAAKSNDLTGGTDNFYVEFLPAKNVKRFSLNSSTTKFEIYYSYRTSDYSHKNGTGYEQGQLRFNIPYKSVYIEYSSFPITSKVTLTAQVYYTQIKPSLKYTVSPSKYIASTCMNKSKPCIFYVAPVVNPTLTHASKPAPTPRPRGFIGF